MITQHLRLRAVCAAASLALAVSAALAVSQGSRNITPTNVISSLGDLDNDKDLDLVVLNVQLRSPTIYAYTDGDTTVKPNVEIVIPGAVDMCLVDVTSPGSTGQSPSAGPDGRLDIVALVVHNQASTLRVWANTGKGEFVEYRPGQHSETYPFELTGPAYSSLWCVPLAPGNGADIFVYVSPTQTAPGTYVASANVGVSEGVWKGFRSDQNSEQEAFELGAQESLESVLDQGGIGVSFVVYSTASSDIAIRNYAVGEGLQ